MKNFLIHFIGCIMLSYMSVAVIAQFIDTSADRVKTPLAISYKQIGTIHPRSTKEITSSRITVGCETLDRSYTQFDAYKDYLPPLGVKKIRLQAGWAKIEKEKGVYDWAWLDSVINFAMANHIEPWLQASYGNPIYNGGGGVSLLNSMMTSPEGYAAWDKWVSVMAHRYKDRVKEWEIWNEPDHPMQKNEPETVTNLNIRTAEIIKSIQPKAKIAGLAFASNSNREYLDRFLKVIADSNKLNLFTWISYHSYNWRPEDAYTDNAVLGLRKVVQKYSPTLLLRQGENGAPSTYIPAFALDKYYWTEYTQAKYDMRRVLGDLGHDIETDVFTIIDVYYDYHNANSVLNTKGLIESDTTKAAIRPKVAYYAIQNIASIFDSDMQLNPRFTFNKSNKASISVYGYESAKSHNQLITLWIDSVMPTNSFKTTPASLTFEGVHFNDPVYIDLMTGHIYEIPKSDWSMSANSYTFKNIPLYDSPIVIGERKLFMKQGDKE